MKGIRLVIALSLCLLLVITGCGNNGNDPVNNGKGATDKASNAGDGGEAANNPSELEKVDLVWYFPLPSTQPDLQTVQDAVNKITLEKINATVTLKPTDFGDYDQKMNTVVASGEKFDIAWTSNWLFFYGPNATKGAFLPLDELLAEHGPELKKTMPEFVWDATRINGKIHGIPNYQTVTNREGLIIQKRLVEKYNLDLSAIKTIKDIEPFLEQVKAGEPDMVPFGMYRTGLGLGMKDNVEYVGGHIIGINHDDPYTAIVIPEQPEYKERLSLAREWFNKELVNRDAATVKNWDDLHKTGKVAVYSDNVLPPGGEIDVKNRNGGHDVVYAYLSEPYTGTNTIITTMQAISRTSENPERAMMFINLLNTDKELYNLISYGIEGKHYEKNGEFVTVNPDAGYNPSSNWVFGNQFNAYLIEGQSQAIMDEVKHENETAKASPLMGFSFNDEKVKAEIANISALGEQYSPGLGTGALDVEKKLPEYVEKLKKAGSEKVREEVQRQIDEWRAANGK